MKLNSIPATCTYPSSNTLQLMTSTIATMDTSGSRYALPPTHFESPLATLSGILRKLLYIHVVLELCLLDSELSDEEDTNDYDEEFRRRLLRIEKEEFLKVICQFFLGK